MYIIIKLVLDLKVHILLQMQSAVMFVMQTRTE